MSRTSTRRELLLAGGALALTASCGRAGPPLARSTCDAAAGRQPSPPPGESRCDLWSYDEIHRASARVYRPRDTADLAALLRALAAKEPPPRITFRGGGQSLDGQSLNDDVVIHLDCPELRRVGDPRLDERGPHVTVGAAATWEEILGRTAAHGVLPYSVVTTRRATAGGTLSADCLSRCSPVTGREGAHVRRFTLLTLDGRFIECRRDDPDPEGAELFHAVIGGFGYLGVVTEITFDLRPSPAGWRPGKKIRALTHVTKFVVNEKTGHRWPDLLPRLREAVSRAVLAGRAGMPRAVLQQCPDAFAEQAALPWDAVSSTAWNIRNHEEALLFRSRYVVDLELSPLPLYEKQTHLFGTLARSMTSPGSVEWAEGMLFALYRSGCYTNELDDFTFFMDNQLTPVKAAANADGFRLNTVQQTFVLPAVVWPEDPWGVARAETFLALVHPRSCPAGLRPALFDVLYLPADEFLLSANHHLDGFAITVTWADRDGRSWDRLSVWLRELSSKCRRLGGRVHLVKNVEADAGELQKMYGPAFARFLELKKRHDPRGILKNAFFDRIFAASL